MAVCQELPQGGESVGIVDPLASLQQLLLVLQGSLHVRRAKLHIFKMSIEVVWAV